MKSKFIIAAIAVPLWFSCNNAPEKNSTPTAAKDTGSSNNTGAKSNTTSTDAIAESSAKISFTAEGKEMTIRNTILVSKDDKQVSPGNGYMAMMIANSHDSNKVSLTLNFAFALQPGTYPIVGYGFQRNVNGKGEVYGGLLGGGTKISPYKVNLTSCEKIRDHHWKIAGTIDEITIPANGLMKMDVTRKHPAEVKLIKISFANMEFDDNLEEMMEKVMKK